MILTRSFPSVVTLVPIGQYGKYMQSTSFSELLTQMKSNFTEVTNRRSFPSFYTLIPIGQQTWPPAVDLV